MRGSKQRNVQVAWHGSVMRGPPAEAVGDVWVSFYCSAQLERAARVDIETQQAKEALTHSLEALARSSNATFDASRPGTCLDCKTCQWLTVEKFGLDAYLRLWTKFERLSIYLEACKHFFSWQSERTKEQLLSPAIQALYSKRAMRLVAVAKLVLPTR